MEIFTGSGEVLSTRIYRGCPPHDHADAGIEFVALDGEATLERVAAYEMVSIYPATQPQWNQAAVAAVAAAGGLEDLELEGLIDGVEVLGLEQQQQQQEVADVGVLGRSLTLEKVKSDLAGSLKVEQQFLDRVLLSPRVTANADMAEKLQQLLLSPRAAALSPRAAALAAVRVPEPREMPFEEEMTADIFGLDDF